jgi:hypothetical protein
LDFLEKVFSQLGERDQSTLREIIMTDEPPVSRADMEELLDNLRIQKIQAELVDVQECIELPEFRKHLASLLKYQRGLRRLLEPHMIACRQIFCRWKAEMEGK